MRAITVEPGRANSAALEEIPEPEPGDGALLVRSLVTGICGTDREIVAGDYGWAPPGRKRLVLGHESLGRVEQAPQQSGFAAGDLVVGIVRRPDPVPCIACGAGEWDMCRNGDYTERGIKARDGYMAEFFRLEPEFAIKLDPALGLNGVLLEPASVLAKAWDHIEQIGHRALWQPRIVLVTGAGPVGLMAALIGVQRGLEVHVLDHNRDGPKPGLVRDLGARFHTSLDDAPAPDVVLECTGATSVIIDAVAHCAPAAIVCLAGVSSGGRTVDLDLGALNRNMVLSNEVVFGSVNANRRHYELAAASLARADPAWLGRLITRRVPIERWREALQPRHGDVKVVLSFE
ncbi:MAG: tdh [Rhodospirillales bacterium]|nr:tdh [Rhodospirillales bacterium]